MCTAGECIPPVALLFGIIEACGWLNEIDVHSAYYVVVENRETQLMDLVLRPVFCD